ncbi:hypothetical protein KIS1582_3322 [Cytobacillus firmus]|uniref:Uncharacterized protein n=1 Tax=Cytobacillus firmus TaxID=1399 RepID=A0A800MUX8_CYTFI|nr:hypothetical protein KIS1582_3322 [Cytobacillus firmus]
MQILPLFSSYCQFYLSCKTQSTVCYSEKKLQKNVIIM